MSEPDSGYREMNKSDNAVPYPLYGKTLAVYSSDGITLSETVYPPNLLVPLHTHNEHGYFNLVLRGGHFESARKRVHECGPFMLSFHPPGTAHSNRFGKEESRLFNIRFDSDVLKQAGGFSDSPQYFQKGLLTSLVAKGYQEFRLGDSLSGLSIEETVGELLSQLSNSPEGVIQSQRVPAWLRRAQEILHCRYNEKLNLSELAAELGVHKVHLARAFRQHFNCTIGEYVRFLRIEFACRQLTINRTSLLDITLGCGFSDQPHFTRTFKRLTGLTPLQYRSIFVLTRQRRMFLSFNTIPR
ncbi:MAG TPA: AraC family transcriptional regulator [Pyrinomonadaceae bacterium]|jgi:AraC-like DNA-binding protein|nr:AraC family transcriptional regulator [Pyrinomonadaceae bacterium]